MWSSACRAWPWEPYSTTNHNPVLCRSLGHWLATARREVRDRSRSSPYPSIRRPQWPCGDRQQPRCPCELLWRCAMKSTYLGRSCRSLPAACRRRGAGSTTSHTLKEHRSRERPKLLTSGLKTKLRSSRAEFSSWVPRSGAAECGSAMFLGGRRDPFTLTTKPRTTGLPRSP